MSRHTDEGPGKRPAQRGPERAAEWAARREQGNLLALRLMAWIAVSLGRRAARLLLHPITLYYLCFAGAPRRQSARYLGRVLGRPASWRERYRHVFVFASTVLDRVYFVRGLLHEFDVHISGAEHIDAVVAARRGAFLLGAHIGSFEALHALRANRPQVPVAMAMYPDNARMISAVLKAVAPDFKLDVIAIGRPGSTLAIRDCLDAGGLVGLLGDRFLSGEATRSTTGVVLPFLGLPTRFSDGPLRLALLLRRPVVFMVGMYLGGTRYDLRFDVLADFSTAQAADAGERERLVREALQLYVTRLESLVREAPYNWFNFYDYWSEDASPPAAAVSAARHG